MAAILGLDELAFDQICAETGVELANINTDNQIVISGDRMAIAHAVDLANARGARKAVPLPVSGAFHSSLMSEAEEGLSAELESLHLREPRVPYCRQLRLPLPDHQCGSPRGTGQWPLPVRPMEGLGAYYD